MGNISAGMQTICENIVTAHKNRKETLQNLRQDTQSIRDVARKFVKEIRADLKRASKAWNEMVEALKSKRHPEGHKQKRGVRKND